MDYGIVAKKAFKSLAFTLAGGALAWAASYLGGPDIAQLVKEQPMIAILLPILISGIHALENYLAHRGQ